MKFKCGVEEDLMKQHWKFLMYYRTIRSLAIFEKWCRVQTSVCPNLNLCPEGPQIQASTSTIHQRHSRVSQRSCSNRWRTQRILSLELPGVKGFFAAKAPPSTTNFSQPQLGIVRWLYISSSIHRKLECAALMDGGGGGLNWRPLQKKIIFGHTDVCTQHHFLNIARERMMQCTSNFQCCLIRPS